MTTRPSTSRPSWLAPVVQAGLAALVAGSLLMFAAIGFRTGFSRPPAPGVGVAQPGQRAPRPVVLPATPRPVAPRDEAGDNALTPTDQDEVVLGTRIEQSRVDGPGDVPQPTGRADVDEERRLRSVTRGERQPASTGGSDEGNRHRGRGKGHFKARGKGHHKGNHIGHRHRGRGKGHFKARGKGHHKGHHDHDAYTGEPPAKRAGKPERASRTRQPSGRPDPHRAGRGDERGKSKAVGKAKPKKTKAKNARRKAGR